MTVKLNSVEARKNIDTSEMINWEEFSQLYRASWRQQVFYLYD